MKPKWYSWAIVITLCFSIVVGCMPPVAKQDRRVTAAPSTTVDSSVMTESANIDPRYKPEPAVEPSEQETTSRFPEQRISLMAVGDIMVHDEQMEAAWDPKTKTYDFHPFFTQVKPLFQEADWVIGNLETTMSGGDAHYSGYPMFNSPEVLATTLKDVGFTAVTTANNHAMDRKEPGIHKTIEYLDQAGIMHTGTFDSEEARNEPLMLTKDGFTLAVLSYTYGTNGIEVPADKLYLINLIQPELIKNDIALAREKGADLVAVALHFGVEYQRMPNEAQKKTAELCVQYGADLILGAHPHVVQPYEWKTVTMEDGRQHKGLITYSLGNFISAQRWDYKDVGAILKLTLHKGETGKASIESVEMIPTYVYFSRKNGKRSYVIYPIPQTLAKLQQGDKDSALTKEAINYMTRLQEEMAVHVSSVVSAKKAS